MTAGFPKRLMAPIDEFIARGEEFTTREITEAMNAAFPHLGATMPSMIAYMGWLHRTGRVRVCRHTPIQGTRGMYDVAVYVGVS